MKFQSVGLMYPQFRAEQGPVPIASNMEQLGEIIEMRVKPGLPVLREAVPPSRSAAYAGYALRPYIHPLQRMDFKDPEGYNELKASLIGLGMAVAREPRMPRQDFYLQLDDCFDFRETIRQNPELWRESGTKQDRFRVNGHILGSIVRLETPDPLSLASDIYNQPENFIFTTRHAVFIPGDMLLAGLCEIEPTLREGHDIPPSLPPKYLADTFDLHSA